MPVRKYQFDFEEQKEITQQPVTKLYEEYIPEEENAPKLTELLFFFNIAAFCILTILFSFVFLSLKLSSFLAFSLAIGASFACIQAYRLVMKFKTQK